MTMREALDLAFDALEYSSNNFFDKYQMAAEMLQDAKFEELLTIASCSDGCKNCKHCESKPCDEPCYTCNVFVSRPSKFEEKDK